MKLDPFASSLVRKSERSIRSAHRDLPRTHRGLIEAFRIHAVHTGRIDSDMASSLSWTEGLRLKADYTGAEIGADVAKKALAGAEAFVRTVETVFGLETPDKHASVEKGSSQNLGKASEPETSSESSLTAAGVANRPSMEEVRRRAAENWRRNFRDKRVDNPEAAVDPADSSKEKTSDTDKAHRERDAGYDFDPKS